MIRRLIVVLFVVAAVVGYTTMASADTCMMGCIGPTAILPGGH